MSRSTTSLRKAVLPIKKHHDINFLGSEIGCFKTMRPLDWTGVGKEQQCEGGSCQPVDCALSLLQSKISICIIAEYIPKLEGPTRSRYIFAPSLPTFFFYPQSKISCNRKLATTYPSQLLSLNCWSIWSA